MKRLSQLVILTLAIICLGGCSLEDKENFQFVSLKIVEAELPAFFELNRTHTINVTFERYNGCVFFESFDVQQTDTTVRTVVAIGTELLDQACTQAIENSTATFNFTVLYEGPYTFRFFNGLDENEQPQYLEYQVEVKS